MKLHFYDRFQCIAGDCPITCCSRWKIAVDEDTYKKWDDKTLNRDGKEQKLTEFITEKEGTKLICMGNSRSCHFLNKEMLCELVICYGDEMLTKTCREFPRLKHEFIDWTEYSLTGCCPVVIDMLNSEQNLEFTKVPKDKDWQFQIREHIVSILKNTDNSIEKALMMGFYLLSEAKETVFYKKEDILELSNALDESKFSGVEAFFENTELFLDVTDNYRKQGIYDEFLTPLTELAEEIEEDYTMEEAEEACLNYLKEYGRYTELLRKYFILEIYNQLLLPDYEWEDMMVAMEWIGMEYVVMRQGFFLQWKRQGELSYGSVKETIVYIARMMGYDAEDIREYMEESFESLIWDWGYFAWIMDIRM